MTTTPYVYEQIRPADLSATDLRDASVAYAHTLAYRIQHNAAPNTVEALLIPSIALVGIASDEATQWGDYSDIEEAIEDYLASPDKFSS